MLLPLMGYIQINGFALAVLALVFVGVWRRSGHYPRDHRSYRC